MDLNGNWQVRGYDEFNCPITFEGTVPGCVHTDLIANGILKDIYFRDNSKKCQWVEDKDFMYTKKFTLDKIEANAYIEFDGLDTYCDIVLNGNRIGSAMNMHISHSFPADGYLKEGENVLQVRFRSAVNEVKDLPEIYKGAFTSERTRTRRIQCTYSWDWVDRFVTCGIYRNVRLVFRKNNEIDNVYVYTKSINPCCAQIKMEINFRDVLPEEDWVEIGILTPDGSVAFKKKRKILTSVMEEYIDIKKPELWYPAGYGEQPLYTIKVSTPTSGKEFKYGIRELTVIQLEDEEGSDEQKTAREMQSLEYIKEHDKNEVTSGFTLLCNGEKIMCKGANWVPCEPFPSEETPEKIKKLLNLARLGNVNMLRVWGGGIFERDEFYEECDRLGIIVTQDFLMACAKYPEEEQWFIEELKKETKYAAIRLRNHPCLAWWSGDNENATAGNENITDFNGYIAATYGIAPILKEYDPMRYFFPSSPYGGDTYGGATKGTAHNTLYLGTIFKAIAESDLSDYNEFFSQMFSRFSAEQAAFGLPFVSTLKKFMTEEDIFGPDQTISEYHMKNNPALMFTLFEYVNMMSKKLFGEYKDGKDRVLKQQMLHTEWIRITLEAHRRRKWFSSGVIYWMYNDCWPAANSWSIVDYYAKPKPAYYAFKRASRPFVASIERKDGKINVYACNDSLKDVKGSAKLYVYDFKEDKNVYEKEFDFLADKNSVNLAFSASYEEIEKLLGKSTVIICDMQADLGSDRAFLLEKRFSDLDIQYTDVEIINRNEDEITVKAKEFTPFVMLDEECLLEENCFMLKKGETKKVKIIKMQRRYL